MALIVVAVVVVARVVPARAAAAEIVTASPTGAAWTALAEMTMTRPPAPTVTPRLAKNLRNRSTARLTRFCAASSDVPRVCGHLAGGLAFEVAQQHRVAVRFAQLTQRGIKLRGDVFPDVRLRSTSAR